MVSFNEHACSQVFLFSALRNLSEVGRSEPYPTAKAPGRQPLSHDNFMRARSKAQEEYTEKFSKREEGEVTSRTTRSSSRQQQVHMAALHLTTRLAPTVFLGR